MSENKGNAEIADMSVLIGAGYWRIFGERLATVSDQYMVIWFCAVAEVGATY